MPSRAEELREAVKLAVEATLRTTEVVQNMHQAIASGPALLGRPLEGLVKLLSAPTYAGIRFVTQLVGTGLDALLTQLEPALGPGGADGAERDLVVGVLNGVLGDVLAERRSVLALPTELRKGSPRPARGRLLVLVHGNSATDACWSRAVGSGGVHFGEVLEQELGFSWVAARYNSGRHVSTLGRELAQALQALVNEWPVAVTEVAVVAHSMGGLVARAACEAAEAQGLGWRRLLRSLIFLGTPHHGAPLERAGSWVEALLGVSRYTAPLTKLAQLRSAGVTDLRFGLTRDEEWQGAHPFHVDPRGPLALPAGVQCGAVAATLPGKSGDWVGDGLVPVSSALGLHPRAECTLHFEPSRQVVIDGLGHVELVSDPRVLDQLRAWLGPPPSET